MFFLDSFVCVSALVYMVARVCGRSHGSEADESDVANIPRTNSTADLVAPALQPHPEGPNIGPGSSSNWFQKDRYGYGLLLFTAYSSPRGMAGASRARQQYC